MAESITQEALIITGMAGATAGTRFVGGTSSGAPTIGSFLVGDYVVDQTGGMYVCTVAGTPGTWQLSGVSVNENIAGKNFVINGGMDLNQRGASTYNIPQYAITYTLDRWFGDARGSGTNYTMSQVSSGLTGIQYALRMQRNSGSTDTVGCWYGTSLETKNSIPMAGKVITFSFYYRTGANYSSTSFNIALYTGTGTDENWANGFTGQANVVNTTISPTASSGWLRYAVTALIGSTATEIGLQFTYAGTGTAGANDYFDITGVQLEIAPQATPFSRAGGSIGGELALCQRYFVRVSGDGKPAGSGAYYTSTEFRAEWSLPVTMRTSPTGTPSSTTALIVYYNSGSRNSTAITLEAGINIVSVIPTTSAATAGGAGFARFATGGYLDWSAEL